MNFKVPKQQVIDNATYRAEYVMRRMCDDMRYRHDPYARHFGDHGGDLGHSEHAVVMAIREAITSIVDDIYTDEEFEQDLGLTKKS